MRLWALSDPHLTLGNPSKPMHVFGENWRDHPTRIAAGWKRLVAAEDVVVLPGDISWASRLEDALADLDFLERLPGTKVIIPGNHERWWDSTSKVRKALPPSLRALDGDHLVIGPWVFFGTRLWEDPENDVSRLIDWHPAPPVKTAAEREQDARIYRRELMSLERSMYGLPVRRGLRRVCLTHYPPIGADLSLSRSAELIAKSGAGLAVFGHLHTLRRDCLQKPLLGTAHGVRWVLASADAIDFRPLLLDECKEQP